MSPLAFDKQGKPFTFQRRTKKLLVRLFRNPSARGTCCQVLDASGQPLYVDPETDYAEFRKAVGQVPGLYRLDQCDEDGNELDDAQAAYVSIDVARNAQAADSGTGDVNPLVIIQQMAAIQADVMKTMAAQQAALMAATAEILRAPYRPAPVAATPGELRNADPNDQDDAAADEEDELEEAAPEHPAMTALRMVEPHLPQLGAFLYEKMAEFLRHIYSSKNAVTPPAATPAPMPVSVAAPAPTAPHPTGAPVGAAAGRSSTPAPAATAATATNAAPVSTPTLSASSDSTAHVPSMTQTTTTGAEVAPITPGAQIAPPIPTREQLAHLFAIREQLAPDERAIAESAIARMDPQMQAQWLAALSDMSVEEATTVIRGMVADIQQRRGSKQQ